MSGSVVERRLRPIYDWLDNGNNKKALQEAEKVLRKTPTLQSARALRALALLRMGRAPEAHVVLTALAEERPSDDTTLQAMTISYRESQQLRKVCELYEAAVKVDPANEELHSHLFMSYVRVGDFKAQQQTAVALYKVVPKNPYYFWAVMSIVLQAKETDDSIKKGVLLSLAQRMVDKFITENKMEAQQEARLYIMILELQEKHEDILKFMETPLYANLVPGVMPQATIPYLHKLRKWRQLNILCKELLWDELDRWDYYTPYLDSVFELMKTEGESSEGSADDCPEKCHEFICSLIENIPGGKTLRGPYLARLELYKRLLAADRDPVGLVGDALDLCLEYLRVFAHKPCCVVDLRPYLQIIPTSEREQRCREFLTVLSMDEHTMPETVEEVQRHVNCLSMWRLCAPWQTEETPALAALFRSHYLRAFARSLAPCTSTEFAAADTYAVLAAHHYYRTALEQQSSAPILEALSLMEFVLQQSNSNFHCKLLALKLYHLLGNGSAAESMYTRLEVKHIQLSSMGWLHTARLYSCGLPTRALQLLSDTNRFHTHHNRDSVDYLTYSYKYGTFEKLCELMEFRSRVERCAWCVAAGLERALLELLTGAAPTFNPPRITTDALSDNRDLSVLVNWDPPQTAERDLQSETFRQELAHVSLRTALVNVVAYTIELAAAVTGNVNPSSTAPASLDKAALLQELTQCVQQIERAFDDVSRQSAATERDWCSISAPFPTRIIALVNSPVPYRELYTLSIQLVSSLAAGSEPADTQRLCQRTAALLRGSLQHLARQLDARNMLEDLLWTNRENLEDVANYIELLGMMTFELGVCNELTSTSNYKKSKKKSHHAPTDSKTTELLTDLNRCVQESIAAVDDLLEKWQEPSIPDDLSTMFSKLTSQTKCVESATVQQKLCTGHTVAINDLRSVLAKKSKLLKTV